MDKMIERWDQLDRYELQGLMSRLARQGTVFGKIFNVMKEGIILLNADGTVSFANPAAEDLLHLNLKDMIGQNIAQNILDGVWTRGVEQGFVSQEIELNYPETKLLHLYMISLTSDEDIPGASEHSQAQNDDGYVLIVRDITTQQKETEEHIESERLNSLTLLAAGVAHEIGNPLNSLGLHLQLIERKLQKIDDEKVKSCEDLLTTARGELNRLDIILKQFLHAIRPTPPQLSPHHLNELLRETAFLLTPEIEQRGIALRYDLEANLPSVNIDSAQIKQVFYNLIRNAYQAIPSEQNGVVSLKTYATDTHVHAVIGDTGSGISPEMMGVLFEPYKTTKSEGNGLGLFIVRRILHDHGGSLRIESEPGKGTRMTVILPRKEREVKLLTRKDS